MPKVLFDRPTGFRDMSAALPVWAQTAGYHFWDEPSEKDPLLVLRDGDVFVVVCEWDAPPSLTELWSAVASHALEGGRRGTA